MEQPKRFPSKYKYIDIATLNLTDTYVLVDVIGWKSRFTYNRDLLSECPQLITGFSLSKVNYRNGYVKEFRKCPVIGANEYKFFKVLN